jgi:hypothetical protein
VHHSDQVNRQSRQHRRRRHTGVRGFGGRNNDRRSWSRSGPRPRGPPPHPMSVMSGALVIPIFSVNRDQPGEADAWQFIAPDGAGWGAGNRSVIDIAAHVTQAPIEGVSFPHTFNQADAPTQYQPGTTRCSVTGPSTTTDGARFVPGLVPASPRRRRRDATTEARSTPRRSPTSKPTTGSSVQRSPSRETASSTTPGGHRCRSPRRPRSTTGPSASPPTCRSPKPAPKASWSPMVAGWRLLLLRQGQPAALRLQLPRTRLLHRHLGGAGW